MNLLKTFKQEWFLKIFVLMIVTQTATARPSTNINENYQLGDKMPVLDDVDRGEEFQQVMHKFLHSNEHKELRKMLKLAIRFLDNEEENTYTDTEVVGNTYSSEMPFYFDHIKSLVNGDTSSLKRRSHRKRSSFDSIGHNGGLGGLGGSHTPRRKLEFTFENLLPYLIERMRRNIRDVSDVVYQTVIVASCRPGQFTENAKKHL